MLNIEIPKLRYGRIVDAEDFTTASVYCDCRIKTCKSDRGSVFRGVHLSSVSPVIHLNRLNPPDSLFSLSIGKRKGY